VDILVSTARKQGRSWSEIADALGDQSRPPTSANGTSTPSTAAPGETPGAAGPARPRPHVERPFHQYATPGLVEALGFTLDRVQGSHHIYRHPDIRQRINLQPRGGVAKPYQLRQVLQVMERNALLLREDTK
jgi:Predicted periplasmic or secreted lipoprotein